MKNLRIALWVMTALAVAFGIWLLLIPTANLHMVLNLRSGKTVAPGKWLLLLPVVTAGLNLWALHDLNPDAKPRFSQDWAPLLAEVFLLGMLTLEQLKG